MDAGALFNHRAGDTARSRALLEGVARLGVEIMNLTPADARELERLGPAGQGKRPQFVAANVFGPGRKAIAPAYLMRSGAAGGRIAFVGLTSVSGSEALGFTVEPPRQALERLLPRLRPSADVVVLLAYMSNRDVVDIAANVPGVDVIVSAFENQFAVAPYQVGQAWILQAEHEGRFVGHAALNMSPEKKLAGLDPHHIVALDASFADDAEMSALLARLKPATPAGNGKAAKP